MEIPNTALEGTRRLASARARWHHVAWLPGTLALLAILLAGTASFALQPRDLTLLTMRKLKYNALAEYDGTPDKPYGHGDYSNSVSSSSTPTNQPVRPPTVVPGPVLTNAPPNPWTNAIIIDLPHPGTVVNLSGAFLRPDLTNIVAISAGKYHALGLRDDLSVVSWGNQAAHDLGLTNVPAHLTNTVAICAGDDYCLTLQVDGTVAAWGSGVCATIPVGLNGIVALAAGPQHAVALKIDGTLAAWGPRASVPPGVSDVKAVAAGEFHTLVARRDGSVHVFGPALESLAGAPTNAVSVMAGPAFYALTADKTLASFGPASDTVPAGLSEVIAFSARNSRCLALKSDGSVAGWGNVSIPASLTNVTAVAAGDLYCLALIVHPPAPSLALALSGDHLHLSSPLAVSGYLLQSKASLEEPWTFFDVSAHALEIEETGRPFLTLPIAASNALFRLKRIVP